MRMVFEKVWTEEQNTKILNATKKEIPALAIEFNIPEKKVLKRFYFLHNKGKKKKKTKHVLQKEKSDTSSGMISVSEAPIPPEAEEMQQRYSEINVDGFPKENSSTETYSKQPENIGNIPKAIEESPQTSQDEMIDWYGMDEMILFFFKNRFENFNKKQGKEIIPPLSPEEEEQLKKGIMTVIEKRLKIINQYSDVISLGIMTFALIVPRMIIGMNYNKENKTSSRNQEKKQEIPQQQLPIINVAQLEKERAIKEYQQSNVHK